MTEGLPRLSKKPSIMAPKIGHPLKWDFLLLITVIMRLSLLYHITSYKCCQASSSSGSSQSFLKEDSLAVVISNLSFPFLCLRNLMKSITSSKSSSGVSSISRKRISFELIKNTPFCKFRTTNYLGNFDVQNYNLE